jgi:hypothetical protein
MNRTLAAVALLTPLFAFGSVALADGNTATTSSIVAEARLAARPLKLSVVDQVIEQSDRQVQSCRRGHASVDTLAVLLRLDIDGDGRVMSALPAQVRADGKQSAEERCLERVATRLKFPSSGAITHLEYPFMLLPSR